MKRKPKPCLNAIETRGVKSYLGIATERVEHPALRRPYWRAYFKFKDGEPGALTGFGYTEKMAVYNLVQLCETIPARRLKKIRRGRV